MLATLFPGNRCLLNGNHVFWNLVYEGEYFDTAHFTDSLKKYPFRAVDVTCFLNRWSRLPSPSYRQQMAKMPFVPGSMRDSNTNDRQYKVYQQIREDVSMTSAPIHREHEINGYM
jgi:DNA polymerase-3 subunit alpha/error-prone DNA polymerase